MQNEKLFFSRFVYNGEFINRACLKKPFERNGFVYASDARIMVRVEKSLCEESYDPQGGPKSLPSFPAPESNYKLDLKELIEILKSIPRCETVAVSGKEAECDECEGDGRVEWTYEDSNGEELYDYFDCPICDGKGKVKTKEIEREERAIAINGTSFNAGLLQKIAEAMNDIGLPYGVITYQAKNSQPMLIQLQEGIEVIIMPCIGIEPCRELHLKQANEE